MDQDAARQNYRDLAKYAGLTTKEIAERSGVSVGTLYNWLKESGPTNLGTVALSKVAETLGVKIEQLFYNPPHEQAGAPPQAPEDWREQIREIERAVRKIRAFLAQKPPI